MDKLVYFGNSADGTPRTGLTPTWVSLLKVSDGLAFTPQPAITEVGVGFYKFPGVVSQDVCGSIDGGATLPAADRYIRDIAMGPVDGYLDGSVAAIQADTDNIQTRLPAALVDGRMASVATGGSGANNVTLTLLNATAAAQTITAATKANPCQLTIAAHGRSNGDKAVITGVGGMVELNNRLVTVTVVDANNVTVGIDSTGFTTYTSGGTITKTDEAAIQSAHLSIYDVTNTNLYATAETNASGVSVQGSNAHVAMDSGDYVLRPTRSLMNATGNYAFTVSATGTKYFVATALTVAASANPDLQRLTGDVKQLGITWAAGDTLTLTPTGTQTVNGMIISNAPLVVTVNASGELIDPVDGLTGVLVDKGAVLLAECKRGTNPVYTYYSKQITITSDAIKDLSTY